MLNLHKYINKLLKERGLKRIVKITVDLIDEDEFDDEDIPEDCLTSEGSCESDE